MKKLPPNPTELRCPACDGTGVAVVMQPVQPGHRIYPPPCKECGGKGRIPRRPIEADSRGNDLVGGGGHHQCLPG